MEQKSHKNGLHPPRPTPMSVRMVVIGHISASVSFLLQAWLERYAHQRVRCLVLDTSPRGDLEESIAKFDLSDSARADLMVQRAAATDDDACAALLRLIRNASRGAEPCEVVLQLPPGVFPEVTAACRQLATRWFRGTGSSSKLRSWAYAALPEPRRSIESPTKKRQNGWVNFEEPAQEESAHNDEESRRSRSTSLEHFRNCVVSRRYPRRPQVLLTGTATESSFFLSKLLKLNSSWVSVVHMTEDCERVEDYCAQAGRPDLVFSDEKSFKLLIAQREWNNSVWVLTSHNHEAARDTSEFYDDRTRSRLPEVVVSWAPEAADEVVPLWVTRPLARSAQLLPSTSCYEPRPELDQVRDLWQAGDAKVVALVGCGGAGKTALVQHLIEEVDLANAAAKSAEPGTGAGSADGVFVWDFYAEPFAETFLRSFAAYLDPDRKIELRLDECLPNIRQAINRRNLRRVLLVMDGLDMIQRVRTDRSNEGDVQNQPVLELLLEIGSGALPIVVLITTRLSPAALEEGIGDRYFQIDIGKLSLDSARNLLRASGGLAQDEDLTFLAERCQRHAMTLYHAGRLVGDFYQGDLIAAQEMAKVGATSQQKNVENIDDLNRGFIELFARYEEHLPKEDVAILKRFAIVGQPLSAQEFTQIFAESDEQSVSGPLARMPREGIQSRFDDLHGRRLLNIHTRGATKRYATHPTLAYYFANAFTAEVESVRLGARDYYKRQLAVLEANDQSSTQVNTRNRGAVRSRRAAVGPRGSQVNQTSNPLILDLLERIILHTIRSGRMEEARLYYQLRLGDEYLRTIGERARAERINHWLTSPARI